MITEDALSAATHLELVAEIRRLRSLCVLAQNRVMSANGEREIDSDILREAQNILDEALYKCAARAESNPNAP